MESEAAPSMNFDKLLGWIMTNKKQVATGVGIAAVVGLTIWFVVYRQSEKEIEAGEALAAVSLSQLGNPEPKTDLTQAYLGVAAEYPNRAAGARAILLAAASQFEAGKYAEARAMFQRFAREHRESPLIGEALLGIATCYDAESKVPDATAAYQDLISHHPSDTVGPQARFALARLYEAQNKPELARNLYLDVERSDPYGSLGPEAGMRVEELQIKYPNLVPKPAPASTLSPTLFPTASPTPATATGSNVLQLKQTP